MSNMPREVLNPVLHLEVVGLLGDGALLSLEGAVLLPREFSLREALEGHGEALARVAPFTSILQQPLPPSTRVTRPFDNHYTAVCKPLHAHLKNVARVPPFTRLL